MRKINSKFVPCTLSRFQIIFTHPFTEEVFAHCLANDEGEEDENALEENWIHRGCWYVKKDDIPLTMSRGPCRTQPKLPLVLGDCR